MKLEEMDEEMSLDVTPNMEGPNNIGSLSKFPMEKNLNRESAKLLENLGQITADNVAQLKEVWELMGIEKENLNHRISTVQRLIAECFDKMLKEEESHKENLLASIDKHLKDQFKLVKELGVERPPDPDHRDSLINLEKTLRDINKQLNEEKAQRMKQVLKYKKENEDLADSLGEDAFYVSAHTIPTEQQIKGIVAHIQLLKETKRKRLAELCESKLYAIQLLEALETEPENAFARSLICEDEENFLLSNENLVAVRTYVNKLEKALNSNEEYAVNLREKINTLYTLLELDDFERMEFLEKHTGHKPSTINDLKIKFDELEELKRINMRKFILATRVVLEKWWQKCFYHKAQCELFTPFYSNEESEEILKAHEDEVDRIKSYYEKNKDLFELFEKRQELWHQMLDLRRKANSKDPNRFKGRQTNFLEEEKLRNRVKKLQPKVEEKLQNAISAYEENNGEPFCVGGIPIQEFLDRQTQELNEEEERDKRMKADQRKKLVIHETIYGSRPVTPAKSGVNTTKRKEIGTPLGPSSSKRLKPSASTTSLAKSSSLARTTTSTKSLPAVTTQQSSNKVKRNILDASEKIITGNQIKPSASVSSLSTTRADFDPFVRSQFNFVNSTMQEETPSKRLTRNNTIGRTPGHTPYRSLASTPQTRTRSGANSSISTPATTGKIAKKKNIYGASPTFKTPSRRILTPSNKTQKLTSLRSGKNLPFLI